MALPDLSTVIGRHPEVVSTKVGDQTMMMSIEQGSYYALEATGARIWDLMEPPKALHDIVACLVTEYEIGSMDCAREVAAFTEKMLNDGLAIEIADA